MIKCQKRKRNLFYFFLAGVLMVCNSGFCVGNNISLQKADSLFQAKKYTESFQQYESLDQSGIATPAMYLKMAYIKEALDDVSGTLFYLNKYYLSTFNSVALKKMESLSEEYQLKGYEYNDLDFFRNLLLNYADEINFFFLFILSVLFIFMVIKIRGSNVIPQTTMLLFFTLMVLFLLNYNIRIDNSIAIVNQDNVFLMQGPSTASNMVEFVDQGHKLRLIDQNGPWLLVDWQGQDAFIKSNNVSLLQKKESVILWMLSKIESTTTTSLK